MAITWERSAVLRWQVLSMCSDDGDFVGGNERCDYVTPNIEICLCWNFCLRERNQTHLGLIQLRGESQDGGNIHIKILRKRRRGTDNGTKISRRTEATNGKPERTLYFERVEPPGGIGTMGVLFSSWYIREAKYLLVS
jgi:hypothetical protein